jgi:HAD superfamily hydrolase (TIGR01509 family)
MSVSAPSPLPDAVLFDMDGLLVDTEPQWFEAERRTVEQLGGRWGKQQQVDLLGSNLEFAARYMIRHTGSRWTVSAVMDLLLENMSAELAQGVRFRPGALELLVALRDESVPLALVTSSVRAHVDVVLAALPVDAFCDHVTGDDVRHLKPHPEPYLTALARLSVEATRCVVLEDSPAGVASAEAAGCPVVAVPSVVPIGPAPARTVVPSLVEVDLALLSGLVTPS